MDKDISPDLESLNKMEKLIVLAFILFRRLVSLLRLNKTLQNR